jgi:serine/threonine protein phosphatase PrpC
MIMEPDVPAEPVQLESSDVVLNCTDGLWGQMSEAKSRKPSRYRTPKKAPKSLVQLAKDHGGPDNITLQILKIS